MKTLLILLWLRQVRCICEDIQEHANKLKPSLRKMNETAQISHNEKEKNLMTKMTSLHDAVSSGNLELVKCALKNGADVNATGDGGETPLHLAAEGPNSVEIVKLLLKAGADIDARNSKKYTPLHIASIHDNIDLMEILLSWGASLNVREDTGKSPLSLAAKAGNTEAVLILLEKGADPNIQDLNGDTPLHYASKLGHYHIMNYLLRGGADPNVIDNFMSLPLHSAAYESPVRYVKILLDHGSDVNAVDIYGLTPLHYSESNNDSQVLQMLLQYHADVNIEPYLPSDREYLSEKYKTYLSYMDLLKQLYKNNAKIKGKDKGLSPIAYAVWDNNINIIELMLNVTNKTVLNPNEAEWPPLHVASFLSLINMTEYLVSKGADVNLKDRFGMTSLHKAVMAEDVGIVKVLIGLKADVDAESFYDLTPLHLATKFQKDAITNVLIDAGANVDKEDTAGFTPLLYAEAGGHPLFEKLLVEKVFDLNSTNRYQYLQIITELIKDNLLYKPRPYRYPTHEQTDWDYFKEKFLNYIVLDVSYDPEYLEFLYDGKLRYILRVMELEELRNLTRTKLKSMKAKHSSLLGLILRGKADIDKQDKMLGWGALHWAAATGDLDSVRQLVSAGASLSLKSQLSQTPMFLARYWGHIDIYSYFKSKGAVW